MMCCGFQYKLEVTFASEAEPQLFLACSLFLGKLEPRSYKIVLIIKSVCMLFCFLILYFFIPFILMQLFS